VGAIYSKPTEVTNSVDYRIADYEGDAAVNITVESIQAFGQNFWPQEYALVQMAMSLNYSGVYWNNAHLNTLFGVTGTSGAMKDIATTTGNIYELTTSLESIPNPEFLSHSIRSSDSKMFQVWGAAGRIATDMNLALTKDAFMTTEMGIGLYADAAGKVVTFYQET